MRCLPAPARREAFDRNQRNENPSSFQRLYRTEDGKWQSTAGFNRDDLLVLGKVADASHTRIMKRIGEQRGQQRQEQPAA